MIEEKDGRLVLHSKRRATLFAIGAAVYGAVGVGCALSGILEGAVISLGLGALLGGTALWRKFRRDEISRGEGKLTVARWLGPLRLNRKEIIIEALALVDHASKPDAMFAVSAMTGPGYLEVRGKEGSRLRLAEGLGYDEAMLRALEERLRKE